MTIELKYDLRCVVCDERFQLKMTGKQYREGDYRCVNCGSEGCVRDFSNGHDVVVNDQTRFRKGVKEDKY